MKIWVRIIAVLEIAGGAFGIGLIIWWFLAAPYDTSALLLTPIIVGVYLLSFVAGIALWRAAPFGRTASIIIQAIQLPKITAPVLVCMFSFGFDLWVQVVSLSFHLRLLAFHQLAFNMPDVPFDLGVSVPALVFLMVLRKYKPALSSSINMQSPPPPTGWSDDNNAPPNNGMHPTARQVASHRELGWLRS
jgi:hypothetical protein